MSTHQANTAPPSVAKPKPEPAKPGRRDEILAAATALFSQHGVHAVTTRQIAAKVGISQPSLYAHFASMQEIQAEVSIRAFALLETLSAPQLGASPQDQLHQTVASYFAFGLTNPEAYRIAFMLEHPKPPVDPSAPAWDHKAFASLDHPGPRLFGHLRQTVAQLRPELPEDRLLILIQCLWASLHGLVSLLIARPDFPWADRDSLIAEQSRLACRMILP